MPEFASYSIYHAYHLQLSARLQAGKRTFVFKNNHVVLSIPMHKNQGADGHAPPCEEANAMSDTDSYRQQVRPYDELVVFPDMSSEYSEDTLPPYTR